MPDNEVFRFKQCINILKSTGKKAANLRELRREMASIPDNSIYHHTSEFFLRKTFTEYTNDFAHWTKEELKETALAERMSNLDPYAFKSIGELRTELLRIIDNYIDEFPQPRHVKQGDEFYFNESVTVVSPIGIEAKNLAEFLIALRHVDVESIYFHFYEARARLGGGKDDFSKWIESATESKELADQIRQIDIFMHTLEGVRKHIIELIEAALKKEMESFDI